MITGAPEIRPTLWPQRLVAVRRSLNRSSRIIVILGLLALFGNALWVWHDRGPHAATFDILEIKTWFHPAFVNSILIAVIMIYAMRQVSRTREKLTPLGYPLLEKEDQYRGVEIWRSVEPLTRRPVRLHVVNPDTFPGGRDSWKDSCQQWLKRAERARRLTSPHISPVIDCGFAQGELFYSAVEMSSGIPLDELVARHGPCPPDRALFLLAQLAHAVQDAHQNGLHHLALHPANIRVRQRSFNEDWITATLFGYEPQSRPDNPDGEDARQFSRIATGLMTGYWLDVDPPPKTAPEGAQEGAVAIPLALRDMLARYLNAGPEEVLPPVTELVQRMWTALPGPAWNNDRAAAWWSEQRNREAAGS